MFCSVVGADVVVVIYVRLPVDYHHSPLPLWFPVDSPFLHVWITFTTPLLPTFTSPHGSPYTYLYYYAPARHSAPPTHGCYLLHTRGLRLDRYRHPGLPTCYTSVHWLPITFAHSYVYCALRLILPLYPLVIAHRGSHRTTIVPVALRTPAIPAAA